MFGQYLVRDEHLGIHAPVSDDALPFPKQVRQHAGVRHRQFAIQVRYEKSNVQRILIALDTAFDDQTSYAEIASGPDNRPPRRPKR